MKFATAMALILAASTVLLVSSHNVQDGEGAMKIPGTQIRAKKTQAQKSKSAKDMDFEIGEKAAATTGFEDGEAGPYGVTFSCKIKKHSWNGDATWAGRIQQGSLPEWDAEPDCKPMWDEDLMNSKKFWTKITSPLGYHQVKSLCDACTDQGSCFAKVQMQFPLIGDGVQKWPCAEWCKSGTWDTVKTVTTEDGWKKREDTVKTMGLDGRCDQSDNWSSLPWWSDSMTHDYQYHKRVCIAQDKHGFYDGVVYAAECTSNGL